MATIGRRQLRAGARRVVAALRSRRPSGGNRSFVRRAYQMILRREADAAGLHQYTSRLDRGEMTRDEVIDALIDSAEFFFAFDDRSNNLALHLGRCQFASRLPAARRILDLGGTALDEPAGALVMLGYRHQFERLVVVDLPSEERHTLYAEGLSRTDTFQSALGPVEYRYHSMTELGDYPDASFDLVYSGQSIEHITESEADRVIAEVHRVLAPGGWFCLDTPNGPVCRLHSTALINPDHKVEYSHPELATKLAAAGFTIEWAGGIGHMGGSLARGSFSFREPVRNWAVYPDPEMCYLLAYHCRRP